MSNTHLPPVLQNLRYPIVGAPMFLVSTPKLVIEQCKAGIVGSFPALNAREKDGDPIQLEAWLQEITEALDRHNQENPDTPAAPFAVNQIVHRSNARLECDVEICAKWKVPLWITSLGAREEVNQAAHSVGGVVLHDVINNTFAKKAIAKGADGLIAVAAGAGGHAGPQSPFALVQEIRAWFQGPLLLSGAIARGQSILAAQAMGADFAYIGTAFIATQEANAQSAYKDMLIDQTAEGIMNTSVFTGVAGNYLTESVRRAGLDPDAIRHQEGKPMDLSAMGDSKAWRDIWGAGQGLGAITQLESTAALVGRLGQEYEAAGRAMARQFC